MVEHNKKESSQENQKHTDETKHQSEHLHAHKSKPKPHEKILAQRESANQQKITELEQALEKANEKVLRIQAEAENTRKRLEKDSQNAVAYANTAFAKDLMEVMENFHRAMDHIPTDQLQENEALNSLFTGVEMTMKSLETVFTNHKIERIYPQGEAFNHDLHQAISQIKSTDLAPNKIVQVVQAGYALNGRLLRPALVIVSSSDSTGSTEPSANATESPDNIDTSHNKS